MELKEALSKITSELKNDIDYRESWKSNIAMAYKDCEYWYKQKTGKKQLNREDKHIIANDSAEYFLKLLCDEYQFVDGNSKPEFNKPVVSGSIYRHPMTYDQPCQIDCRVTSCKFYQGAGVCNNVSPAITLNDNGKFVCLSKTDR